MSQITNVTFLRSAGMYRTGETAGFPAEQAKAIIASGAASLCEDNPHPKAAAPSGEPGGEGDNRRAPPLRGMTQGARA